MKTEKEMGYYEKRRKYYGKVTKLYFDKGLGYRRINKLIPVSITTLKRWCDTFAEENGITMEKKVHKERKKPDGKVSESTEFPNDIKSLQAEIANLQKELRHEKLRADSLEAMIDIAETKFNIPIRKKAGAKR